MTIAHRWRVWALTSLMAIAASPAAGQTPQGEGDGDASKVAVVAGTTFTTMRAGCQTCEQEFPYRHTGGVFGAVRYRPTTRMDVGGEVLWAPATTESGDRIRTTHVDAVAQFRPWESKGFFIKGGAGIAFIRNWVDIPGASATWSKALSVEIGGGWAFRRSSRIGVEVFAAQHAAGLGDITTSTTDVQDVLGNFWSLGVAIILR